MKKVNSQSIPEDAGISPKGKFGAYFREISVALGRDPFSTDLMQRHPFDVELVRVAPGKPNFPYHSHSAQWEFYYILTGRGQARDEDGLHEIEAGDAFVFRPGEAHQIINPHETELTYLVIADNPIGESSYYPDSKKWLVRSPERALIRSEGLDYYDGEE